jgi:xanthine dehydrogenase large subunit
MQLTEAEFHARGESLFTADYLPEGTLFAAVFASPEAHGEISHLDIGALRNHAGVVAVLTARDVPGENQIGNIIQDEPLLAAREVHYAGQPIALVVAESEALARRALSEIHVAIRPKPAVFEPREAFRRGDLIGPVRSFALGDVDSTWPCCDVIVEGRVDTGAQEHLYMEMQNALAIPQENGGLRVFSSTQSPSMGQRIIARVLGCAMHQIEVEVTRLGGAFGGKEEQATPWAALAALAAHRLQKPVKLALRRSEDMRMTGKRHPYSSDFKMGLSREGKMLAYEAHYYQNAGATADLSTAVLERSMFHATGSYFIPNVRIQGACCRTNLPSNTACRGFGAPQATFVMEAAIFQAAQVLNVDPAALQRKNLLHEGDQFPYGMRVENCRAESCWEESVRRHEFATSAERIARFNAEHVLEKKGIAMIPLCFGISFTSTFLNQASALVHVYTDGSVSVSTGAIEVGQGVKAKIQAVAARTFSIAPERIKVESTSTTRIANASPTAASTAADMNGHATRLACLDIAKRLQGTAARLLSCVRPEAVAIVDEVIHLDGVKTGLHWEKLIAQTYLDRVSLSAHAHYATPKIHFDRNQEKGKPFAYHVFGTAVVEVTLDGLRGTYRFDSMKVVHDAGASLHPAIDRGQVEGGAVQGLGWVTLEEIIHDGRGRLLTDDLTSYKIPDLYFAPEVQVHFLEHAENPQGLFHSKAIGEPPFLYGIAGYFALLKAMQSFRPDVKIRFDAPLTPEKVLMALYAAS